MCILMLRASIKCVLFLHVHSRPDIAGLMTTRKPSRVVSATLIYNRLSTIWPPMTRMMSISKL